MVKEKGWRDLGSLYATMLMLGACTVGGWLSGKLDACARQGDAPRDSYRKRDVVKAMLGVPARKTEAIRTMLTDDLDLGPALSTVAMLAGIGLGIFAFNATSASLGMAAALAAGIVAAPLAATVIGAGISVVLPMALMTACFWPQMLAKGWREAQLCSRHKNNPQPRKAAAPLPKHPPLTRSLEGHLRTIGMSKGYERENFFRTLRKRFPEEFNEAANLKDHDPVLRAPVSVRSPLKLRAAPKDQGGAA